MILDDDYVFSHKKRSKSHYRSWDKHRKAPWFSELIGRRAARIERGETRFLILDALAEKARHGYEIMQIIQERSGGHYRPSPGNVYPTLQMLEDLELVCSQEEGNRKNYELTNTGREELERHRPLVEDIYDTLGYGLFFEHTEFFDEIQNQMMKMFKLISKSFHRGRLEHNKKDEIQKAIEDAVRRIDEILKRE